MPRTDLSQATDVAYINGDAVFCGDSTVLAAGPGASKLELVTYSASVTLSGATTSFTNAIPDGAMVIQCDIDITTAITGASGWTTGDGTDADRWGSKTGTAVGTKTDSRDYTAGGLISHNAATSVVLTALTSNFTAGVARLVLRYLQTRSAAG